MLGRAGPTPLRKACEAAHTLGVAAWLGAVAMSGVVAAIVFPLLRKLDPRVGAQYAGFEGDHPNLLAGMVAARVFSAADMVAFAGAITAMATLIMLIAFMGLPIRRWSTAVRLVALCSALALLSTKLMVIDPPMAEHLNAYWSAAAAGDTEAAEAARAAFGQRHPTVSRVMGGMVFCLVAALLAGSWSSQTTGRARGSELGGKAASSRSIEAPALLRGGGR